MDEENLHPLGGLLEFLPNIQMPKFNNIPFRPNNQGMQTYQNEGIPMQTYQNEGTPMETYDYNYPEMDKSQLYDISNQTQQGIGMPLYTGWGTELEDKKISPFNWRDFNPNDASYDWVGERNREYLDWPGYTTYSGGELGHLPIRDYEGMPVYKPSPYTGEMQNISTFPYEMDPRWFDTKIMP